VSETANIRRLAEVKADPEFVARIADDLSPESVLDVGCGSGQLVAALRASGVSAFGLNPASDVPDEVALYCQTGSLMEPLPQHYSLIVCAEVMQHLAPESAEAVVANLCRHAEAILFYTLPTPPPFDTAVNRQPPEYWAAQFAQQGFWREPGADALALAPWAVYRRRSDQSFAEVVRAYENRQAWLARENDQLHRINLELRQQMASNTQTVLQAQTQLKSLAELREAQRSLGWRASHITDRLFRRLAPPHTLRGRLVGAGHDLLARAVGFYELFFDFALRHGLGPAIARTGEVLGSTLGQWQQHWLARFRVVRAVPLPFTLREPEVRPPLAAHSASVDIIVCVHNALDDAKRCLESVVRYTRMPYRLVLVDDGSEAVTATYLQEWAMTQGALWLRDEPASGYTRAANRGLRQSAGDYVVMLNSDTLVTPDWLDRLIACAESDPRIGLVGPLSNTASWQSVPELLDATGDWADNPLPQWVSPAEYARSLAALSGRLYPRLAFLNGFCLLIKRAVIDEVGLFDEATFGQGYGEENDYCLRARELGWQLAVADDTFVYHAQSRSYSHERRRQLSEAAHEKLIAKHGPALVYAGAQAARTDRVMAGIRARAQVLPKRQALIESGQRQWEGRRILFLLPVREGGGGANVILQEAAAIQRMGVQTDIVNLNECRVIFERGHPDLPLHVIWVDQPREVASLLPDYDAVIATYNVSVAWMESLNTEAAATTVRGYYIQDFEPFFYADHSSDYERALRSYTLFPDLVRVTKTAWNRAAVKAHTGADSVVVGPSLAVDLFRPRPAHSPQWPDRPLRIAAMIRPSSPRREPRLTMELLAEASRAHGVEVVIFGCENDDPGFLALPRDFNWRNVGVVRPTQLASLFGDVDVFVDFSSFQAMGLTAMEAMACGLAVIVPGKGGAVSFARHERNCLVVETESKAACWAALERLIREPALRRELGWQALHDMVQYHPEGAAYQTLTALFPATAGRD